MHFSPTEPSEHCCSTSFDASPSHPPGSACLFQLPLSYPEHSLIGHQQKLQQRWRALSTSGLTMPAISSIATRCPSSRLECVSNSLLWPLCGPVKFFSTSDAFLILSMLITCGFSGPDAYLNTSTSYAWWLYPAVFSRLTCLGCRLKGAEMVLKLML